MNGTIRLTSIAVASSRAKNGFTGCKRAVNGLSMHNTWEIECVRRYLRGAK